MPTSRPVHTATVSATAATPATWTCTGVGGRGCPCAWHVWNRRYQRDAKRRQRARELDAKRRSARTCPRRLGRHGVCGAVLEERVDAIGRVTVVCPACERFAAGICARCPQPVYGQPRKARWCATHRKAAQRAARHRNYYKDVARSRRRAREDYRDPAKRAERDAYRRAWALANAPRVAAAKRESSRRCREHRNDYFRRRYAALKGKPVPAVGALRTCIVPGCDIVLTGRKKKCTRCKERDRQRAVAVLGPRARRVA